MNSSAGNLAVDRLAVEQRFTDIIGVMAHKRFGINEAVVDDSMRDSYGSRLARWMDGSERQRLVTGLVVGFATITAGSIVSRAASSATFSFKAPSMSGHKLATGWAAEELKFWQSTEDSDLLSLAESLRSEAASALARMLPATMTESQAVDWATKLATSVKG